MAKRRKSTRGADGGLFAAASGMFVLLALAAAVALVGPEKGTAAQLPPGGPAGQEPVAEADRGGSASREGTSQASEPVRPVPALAVRPQERKEPAPPRPRALLAIVIDDVGHNLHQLEPFLKLPFPIAFAVLPELPYTTEAAALIREAGKELLLHQPMEALGELDEGPGAIYRYMESEEIQARIDANLDQVPGAIAINNHMGSAATGDERLVRAVLEAAGRRGLRFLDSLTSGDSVVESVTHAMNFPHLERDVFLDNKQDRASILEALEEGARRAERKGHAVMIGHVWSAELAQTLMELYPELVERGFSLSTISRLMMDDLDEDTGD